MSDDKHRIGGTADDWEAFVNAVQILVLVAGEALRSLPQHEAQDTCREVVSAAARVLELTHRVLPPVSRDTINAMNPD